MHAGECALSELLEAYDTAKLEAPPLVVLEPEKDDWRTLIDWENLMWIEYAETQSVEDGASIHKIVSCTLMTALKSSLPRLVDTSNWIYGYSSLQKGSSDTGRTGEVVSRVLRN